MGVVTGNSNNYSSSIWSNWLWGNKYFQMQSCRCSNEVYRL